MIRGGELTLWGSFSLIRTETSQNPHFRLPPFPQRVEVEVWYRVGPEQRVGCRVKARGFIFQATYRIHNRVPVVHLYGRLDSGETFLVRDHGQRPYFYIHDSKRNRVPESAGRTVQTDRVSFDGRPVARVEVALPQDAAALRDRLHGLDIDTFEADVRFAVRYLIDRDIRGGCEIDGNAVAGKGVNLVFDDPVVTPAEVEINPSVLSFDIETDPAANRLLAISMFGPEVDEVLVVDPRQRQVPGRARSFPTEKEAMLAFLDRLREIDPDVLTGWNVIDFDLTVLSRIADKHHLSFEPGRESGRLSIRPARGYFGSGQAFIPGRLVLDGIDLLRGAFIRMEDFSLDTVARKLLGEGKRTVGDVNDRVNEIQRNYAHNLEQFVDYAATDARLVYEILKSQNLMELAIARSRLTGMTPDRVAASIASFDFLYLGNLRQRRVVASSVRSEDSRVSAVAQAGGHVLEPVTGRHQNVWVYDFKSLYPAIIRTLNIDPLGYCPDRAQHTDLIETVNGALFRRDPAILPQMLDELFPKREAAKRRGDQTASHAIKILMNSFYGVLGTPACRFYNPEVANAITSQGKHFLLWAKKWFEEMGYKVLYGDTDSLFVSAGDTDGDIARLQNLGKQLSSRLSDALGVYVKSRWRVNCYLELEFEKLYVQLFLPSVRHGAGGARKRYAGRLHDGALEFVGMEVVRRDWTDLAKTVQRELYERLFSDAPVDEYLYDTVARVRAGELDADLVYRKGLRKLLDAYTASTPPHVAAARKSSGAPGRIIAYVMTVAGPEPLDNLIHEPDREHYVSKQIRPVAEPVLEALGLEFDRVIGDDRQIGLF